MSSYVNFFKFLISDSEMRKHDKLRHIFDEGEPKFMWQLYVYEYANSDPFATRPEQKTTDFCSESDLKTIFIKYFGKSAVEKGFPKFLKEKKFVRTHFGYDFSVDRILSFHEITIDQYLLWKSWKKSGRI